MSQGVVSLCRPAAAEGLGERCVHIWCISLDADPAEQAGLSSVLSGEELERVARFRFEADRRRALVARGSLRMILGSLLNRPPESLRFRTSETGKPELDVNPGDAPLSFNVSHSGDRVLIGVARDLPVGVDVERIREQVEVEQIADRFFAPEEADAIRSTPAQARRAAFYSYWTAKEAYLKALGCGLAGGMSSFALSPRAGGWAIAACEGRRRRDLEDWTIVSLKPAEGYAAAVAVKGPMIDLKAISCANSLSQTRRAFERGG